MVFVPFYCFSGINFIHIPKCAGSTLRDLLHKNFKLEQIYLETTISQKNINQMPFINHKLTVGHLPYWFFVEKDINLSHSFTFTVLRDPIERVISLYFYWKKYLLPYKSRNDELTLSDIPKNRICTILCSDPSLKDESLLLDAISILKKLDFVFFVDDYEDGVRKLFSRLDLKLPLKIPHMNAVPKTLLDNATLKQIAEDNALDFQLYNYAKSHYRNNKIY